MICWYEPNGHIAKNSDDTRQLKYDSDIFSLSCGPANRIFILKQKSENQSEFHVHLENNNFGYNGWKMSINSLSFSSKINIWW